MLQLLLGLALFFGVHSVSIVALRMRNSLAAKSEIGWKVGYSLISLVGLILISRGYVELRMTPTVLYVAPVWLYHVAAVLLLPVFILFVAPYFPGRISKTTVHPQLVAVKLWAASHLLVNGTLADLLLFGTFLAWAVADRISMKHRVSRAVPSAPESKANDVIAVLLGLSLYAVTVFWAHEALFGIRPLVA